MALITKEDIENELMTELDVGYTSSIITGIIDTADDLLKLKTSRATFTGSAANLAKYAEVCIAIDRLILSNRDLVKTAIDSISENGASIKFSNGKTLASYRAEANSIISDLKLPGSRDSSIVFADPSDSHTGTEGSILY
jgi:hypothetical protein